MDELNLFLLFLRSSALSVGGLQSLPLIRDGLVPAYATDAQVLQALAIGRLSPGPNGLYLVSLGYLIAGWPGAALACAATSVAPLVILPATALARRWLLSRWFAGLVRGVTLASAGLLAATGVLILLVAGTAPWQLALAAGAAVLTIQGRIHPAVLVAIGAAVGLALGR